MESRQVIRAKEIRRTFPPDWEVPEFRVEFWDGKTSDYCVVVPVINEGYRIRHFVHRLKDANVDAIADIIIVDGGSTDGSLEQEYLRSYSVRGLLTKSGPGKLSSQLRVAYAFSLLGGYDGIVTIDGNNKDDPQAIHDFIRLAQNGYDFIQASRFLRGTWQSGCCMLHCSQYPLASIGRIPLRVSEHIVGEACRITGLNHLGIYLKTTNYWPIFRIGSPRLVSSVLRPPPIDCIQREKRQQRSPLLEGIWI